jgi:hypothetical protein
LDKKSLILETKVNTNSFKITTILACNVEDGLFSSKDLMAISYGQVKINKNQTHLQF